MRAAINQLKKFVNLQEITIDQLVKGLNLAGIEVEEVIAPAVANNVVIGQVVSLQPVVDTHLNYLQVFDGKINRKVICGAANVVLNAKVALALPGAKLANMVIKESEIRGLLSEGMCCSYQELSIFANRRHLEEGIIILDSEAPVGADAIAYLGLDDYILDIKVTPNRGDCLSIIGLAKEISAIFKLKFLAPNDELIVNIGKINKVIINTDKCSYFSLREVKNVKVKKSPQWLVNFLFNHNLRPINNIVDISNYILITYGQPLHIYDKAKIKDADFVIVDDYQGPFTTLLDQQIMIEKNDILIKPGAAEGCLGGIIGAKETAISDSSNNVLIEAAIFDQQQIRLTSKRLDLVSESSNRFVRGVNPYYLSLARDEAMALIIELAEGSSDYTLSESGKIVINDENIVLTLEDVNKLLGTNFNNEILIDTFNRLSLKYQLLDNVFYVKKSIERKDINIKEDLIEEIIRLQGFDKLPVTLPYAACHGGLNHNQQLLKAIKQFLINNSLFETVNYSLIAVDEDCCFVPGEAIKLLNPISNEHQFFRKSLISSLLSVARFNNARQTTDIAIFEEAYVASKTTQKNLLSILLTGNKGSKLYPQVNTVATIKGILLAIINLIGIDENRVKIKQMPIPLFHQGRSALLTVDNKEIACFGQISHQLAASYELKETLVAEIDLTSLFNIKAGKTKLEPISAFPSSSRDIAFVVKEEITINDISETIKKSAGPLLHRFELFDIYRHDSIGANLKSIAINLIFGSYEKTLTDQEVNATVNLIIEALKNKLDAKIRD